jgi:hypothetical protein
MHEVLVPSTAVEAQPQGIPPLDVWMIQRIDTVKAQLGEGERVDPWYISDSFLTYKEVIHRAEMDVRGAETASNAIHTEAPAEQRLHASVQRLHDAYDITAYPFYSVGQQRLMSDDVHRYHARSSKPFTLQQREKETLQKITTAIGIADDPKQVMYSFASLPQAPKVVKGSITR